LEVPTAFDILEIGAEEVEVAVEFECLIADVLVPLRENCPRNGRRGKMSEF
jgi:hypothetical protein